MRFYVLESLSTGERSYTTYPNKDTRDPTLMRDGSVGYKLLKEVRSDYEAQAFLFGTTFADRERDRRRAEGRE